MILRWLATTTSATSLLLVLATAAGTTTTTDDDLLLPHCLHSPLRARRYYWKHRHSPGTSGSCSHFRPLLRPLNAQQSPLVARLTAANLVFTTSQPDAHCSCTALCTEATLQTAGAALIPSSASTDLRQFSTWTGLFSSIELAELCRPQQLPPPASFVLGIEPSAVGPPSPLSSPEA